MSSTTSANNNNNNNKSQLKPLFGININPNADGSDLAFDLAGQSDKLGINLISIQDHPYNGSFFDTWTLITALAMSTKHIHVMTNVADIPIRHPPLLAKSAATLDILTKGRVELGIGAGAFWRAIVGYGGPSRTPQESVSALEEAIQIIRLVWNIAQDGKNNDDNNNNNNNARATFHGKFYNLDGAQTGPQPFHPIRIWVGSYGPRMLKLTGRLADGWTPSYNYAPPQNIPEMQKIIDESAIASTRKPNEVRRNYNLPGKIVFDDELQGQSQTGVGLDQQQEEGLLIGPIDFWVNTLVKFYNELGMDTFTFWPVESEIEQMEIFAKEVIPKVKDKVAL